MHSRTLVAALLLLTTAPFARAAALEKPLTDSEVRQLIQEAVEKEKRAPGMAVGMIDASGTRVIACGSLGRREGLMAWLKAPYFSRQETGTGKVDGDSLFEIGSITKTFTALLLQDMVDRGEVKLDDPISKFLPASVKTPARNGREITLLDLATHTSGLPRLPFSKDYLLGHLYDPYADFKVKDFYQFLSTCELKHDIGTHFEYSNAGMALLGHCLELRAKTNYEALVRQRICQPLGMTNTCVHLSAEQKTRAAAGHDTSCDYIDSWSPSDFPADGELRSTVNDMLKYLAAQMALTNSSLSNAMAQTHLPRRKTDDSSERIGLGWMVNRRTGVRWHDGATQGFVAYTAFNAAEHRGVILLSNSDNDVEDLGEMLVGIRKWRKVMPMDPEIYNRYTGKFDFDGKRVMKVFRRGDRLFLRVTGQPRFELFPESETEFFLKALNGQAKFLRDPSGHTTGLIWYQDGSQGTEMKRLEDRGKPSQKSD